MKSNKKIAINIDKVSKRYFLRNSIKKTPFLALQDVNLKIFQGEKIAILGDNGAGKTTLLKLMTGIAEPTSGSINRFGKVVSLIDITAGFHEEFSGRENIYLNGILLGMNTATIKKLEQKIIDFSGIERFIDQALYTYSSGMILRLGFSIAINADPDILILDEGIIVGDQDFQKKAYDKVEEIFSRGKTVIVCSHMLPLLSRLCDRFIWIDEGMVRLDGDKKVIVEYKKKRNNLDIEKISELSIDESVFFLLKEIEIGKEFILIAASSSMEPLILKGDEISILRCNMKNIGVGDIIAYWNKDAGNIIVHRVYKKLSKTKLVTKGDSSVVADDIYISESILLGKVINFNKN